MLDFSCRVGDEFVRVVVVGLGLLMAGTVISGTPARAGSVSFTDFNLVTIGAKGDPTQGNVGTQSDVTGSAFVSGSLQATLTVAQDLPTVPNPSTSPVYGLEVLNKIESGINVNNGYSVEYAGTTAGNINLNGGGVLTKDAGGVLAAEQTTLYNQVTAASVDFKNLSTVGSSVSNTPVNTQPALTFNYTGPANGVAVFDITSKELQTSNLQLYLNPGQASSVVINVSGSDIGGSLTLSNISFVSGGGFSDAIASKILWNFEDVTGTLNPGSGGTFLGSILAPTATLDASNAIDGSVFVESVQTAGEIHYKNNGYVVQYNGFNPLSVPEPSSMVMAALGMLGIGAAGWGRRRASEGWGLHPPILSVRWTWVYEAAILRRAGLVEGPAFRR